MQLPAATSHYSARVRFGRYVARRLKRARFAALAADATNATAAVLAAGRAAEDAEGPVQDALADRDGFDDDLDTAAQNARANLAGRSADATTKAPYVYIFPDGVAYYLASPLDEQIARYSLLNKRLAEHLPADDEVRTATTAAIASGLAGFGAAVTDLTAAHRRADGRFSSSGDAHRHADGRVSSSEGRPHPKVTTSAEASLQPG